MRFVDIIFSILGLMVFFVPGLIVVLILKVYSFKNILFFQIRVGKNNKEFKIIKFVTMINKNSQNISKFVTINNDPRIYPIGKFLRNSKINEIPQLLNILRGDMSLIGPRPLPPETFNMYPDCIKKIIIKKRPGLSGVGSIVFSEENKLLNRSDNIDFYFNTIQPYKGELEKWFIENYSISLCLKLIILTFIKVILRKSIFHWSLLKNLPPPPKDLKVFLRYPY